MKNSRRLLFIFLCTLLFTSCRKNATETVPPVYEVTANVNGNFWKLNNVSCTLFIDTTYHFRLVYLTTSNAGVTISIEFSDNASGNGIKTGTHSYPNPGDSRFYYSVSGPTYQASSGSINITSNNASAKLMSATFSFIANEINGSGSASVQQGLLTNINYSIVYK